MGCNAWNHSQSCTCGWGGDTGGGARRVFVAKPVISAEAAMRHTEEYKRSWSFAETRVTYDSFINPNAKCPVCGAEVFFYQSPHGGRVYFDDLGRPWPKHPCTDNPAMPASLPRPAVGQRPPRSDRPNFEVEGWRPIFQAKWRPWASSEYIPGILSGLLGRARTPFKVLVPYAVAIDPLGPLFGKPHAENTEWLWVDGPEFIDPILTCARPPKEFALADLAGVAVHQRYCATLVRLAHLCSFAVEEVPGQAKYHDARRWLETAAAAGDWRAMNNLGLLYECGLGTVPDVSRAKALYSKAARIGGGVAKINLKRVEAGEPAPADPRTRARLVAHLDLSRLARDPTFIL